ncbi:MAG: biotin/lipoyl-binding protein [Acidobacteria bacterium]|nr:biotin/lipoyl-binding protein [Acidobacteriota bacterium]
MKLKIAIDGKKYEVDVEAVEPTAPSPLMRGIPLGSAAVRVPAAPAPAAAPAAGDNKPVDEAKVCRSPVSGIVIRVAVQAGQSLQPGDVMLVLEAMKMETNITAPAPGKIAAIPVKEGDSVQSGQVVVEFE